MRMERQRRTPSRFYLPAAFAVLGASFLAMGLAAVYRLARMRADIDQVYSNALVSIELVSRMGHDIDHERLLADAHIFEKQDVSMTMIEQRIGEVQADFETAARAYGPVATLPLEGSTWRNLQADVAAVKAPMDEALALSRANKDTDARKRMSAVEERFDTIDEDIARLVAINQHNASQAMDRIHGLQHSQLRAWTFFAAIGMLASAAVALRVTRVVRRWEAAQRDHAAALETRNRGLDAFAGHVAHDLRGPLTTVRLAASRVASTTPEESQTRALLHRGVDRMEALIQTLLMLSRVDATALAGTCDPAAATATAVQDLAVRRPGEGGTLRTAVVPSRVRCHDGLLVQVVYNLVDNGLKYRRDGVEPVIEIVGVERSQGYELTISDNGIGMSPDEMRHAFEPFFRAHRVRSAQGTGLGLSIVKRAIEAVGGTIDLESRVGQGSRFTLHLKRSQARA